MRKYDKYKKMIISKQAVLFIKGKPGTGKSAIIKNISEIEKWKFFDIRLAQIDSAEILGIPKVSEIDGVPVMKYCVPDWAFLANKQPSIIFFDELNRAKPEVRDAALQILLDRQIGFQYKFNDDVYFCAAGNMGEEDGCEVEEFDKALQGRLATVIHNLELDEWIDEFAEKNCNSYLIDFLKANPSYFYKINQNEDAYCNPRSWTFLSNIIGKNEKDIQKIKATISEFGNHYVSSDSILRFNSYLTETQQININDVVYRYKEIEEILSNIARSKMKELTKELEKIELGKLKKKEYENVVKYLNIIDNDERIGYFKYLADNCIDIDEESNLIADNNLRKLAKEFQKDFMLVFEISEEDLKAEKAEKEGKAEKEENK
jgi:hypothetical protein